ncbi:MAG: Crp/Fnr family transcriptional regulator [Bacteroidota bacterium]
MKNERFKYIVSEIVNLSSKCWDELESKMYSKRIKKDNFFSKENSNTKEIAFIMGGLMRIYYLDDQGNEWNKKFLSSDDFVMASINPSEKSSVYIQSIKDTELTTISYSDFLLLTNKYPKLMQLAYHLTSQYLSTKEEREITLLSINGKERYMRFTKEYATIKDELPQYHISSYLGITPTQLSRLKKEISENQHL